MTKEFETHDDVEQIVSRPTTLDGDGSEEEKLRPYTLRLTPPELARFVSLKFEITGASNVNMFRTVATCDMTVTDLTCEAPDPGGA